MRVFCAIELSDETRARSAERVARLREAAPRAGVRWVEAGRLHITMQFYGEIAPEQVALVEDAARQSAGGAFTIRLEGAGTFPARGTPRVWWLGVADESGGLRELQTRLANASAARGFPVERRAFNPHITIGRTSRPSPDLRDLARSHQANGFDAGEMSVRELVVMRSELGAEGARYTPLSRVGLKSDSPIDS